MQDILSFVEDYLKVILTLGLACITSAVLMRMRIVIVVRNNISILGMLVVCVLLYMIIRDVCIRLQLIMKQNAFVRSETFLSL